MQTEQQLRLKQRLDSCCLCRTQKKLGWSGGGEAAEAGEEAGRSRINSGKLRASAWERGDCAIVGFTRSIGFS